MLADNEAAFFVAFEDIISKRREAKSVILYPRTSKEHYSRASDEPAEWSGIKALLRDMTWDRNLKVVVSAGNGAPNSRREESRINTFPAIWGDANPTSEDNLPIMVVSAVNNIGQPSFFSRRARVLDIYAPGEDVTCAGRLGEEQTVMGASAAAGMVMTRPV